jgi:hypothetical protein
MNNITFGQAWNYGGPLMWVLAGFSVLSLAVMLYLLVAHSPFISIPMALKRIHAAKDPEAEGSRIAERMMSAVDWLADIAAIAPLVGLLGTVLGMFQAFGGIASDVAAGAKPVVLAQGVSQAIRRFSAYLAGKCYKKRLNLFTKCALSFTIKR